MVRGDYRLVGSPLFPIIPWLFHVWDYDYDYDCGLDRSVSCNHSPQKKKKKEAIHFPCGCLVYRIWLTDRSLSMKYGVHSQYTGSHVAGVVKSHLPQVYQPFCTSLLSLKETNGFDLRLSDRVHSTPILLTSYSSIMNIREEHLSRKIKYEVCTKYSGSVLRTHSFSAFALW